MQGRVMNHPKEPPAQSAPASGAEAPNTVKHVRFVAASGIEGFVDRFGPARIHGWALPLAPSTEPQALAFYDGERF